MPDAAFVLRALALVLLLAASASFAQTPPKMPTLVKPVEPVFPASLADAGEMTTQSDAEGLFEFTDVPMGPVEVKVTAPHFEP